MWSPHRRMPEHSETNTSPRLEAEATPPGVISVDIVPLTLTQAGQEPPSGMGTRHSHPQVGLGAA